DRLPRREVRRRDVDVPVETPGTEQRGVDQVHAVRRRDHGDVVQLLEPVHLREYLRDLALGDLRIFHATSDLLVRGDFLEEDDVWSCRLRLTTGLTAHPLSID